MCLLMHRRFFDPEKWKIVLVDQRGCGASKPKGDLKGNTTQVGFFSSSSSFLLNCSYLSHYLCCDLFLPPLYHMHLRLISICAFIISISCKTLRYSVKSLESKNGCFWEAHGESRLPWPTHRSIRTGCAPAVWTPPFETMLCLFDFVCWLLQPSATKRGITTLSPASQLYLLSAIVAWAVLPI